MYQSDMGSCRWLYVICGGSDVRYGSYSPRPHELLDTMDYLTSTPKHHAPPVRWCIRVGLTKNPTPQLSTSGVYYDSGCRYLVAMEVLTNIFYTLTMASTTMGYNHCPYQPLPLNTSTRGIRFDWSMDNSGLYLSTAGMCLRACLRCDTAGVLSDIGYLLTKSPTTMGHNQRPSVSFIT